MVTTPSEPSPLSTDQPSEEKQQLADRGSNRSQRPSSQAFRDFMASDWAPRTAPQVAREDVADHTERRRAQVSAAFPGERLVVPAGGLKVRSNDTDYRFRPHSAFAHLTGLGSDEEPDAVLVLSPEEAGGHEAVLYFRPLAGRDTEEFYADARYGEFWVGARPTLEELETRTGLRCAHIDELGDALAKDAGLVRLRVVPGADQAISAVVNEIRDARAEEADAQLAETLSELRLVKDDWEVEQLREAVAVTIAGFGDIAGELDRATSHPRGERVIEGAFGARAREEGNGIGYDTIAAAGNHATTLHWIRNDGTVRPGELVLVDAGVEVDSLYTADITRTLPVDGTFTDTQRRVYTAVLDAADAAFAFARPGVKFRDIHTTALRVLAERLQEWGLLPVSVEAAISAEGQQHRRWMPHGTSHHLGLDVHDCAQARREMYLDAELVPGMVFTIEPGLYFKADDLAVPAEYRGIGVRIEDDVLVTETGVENLSAALPRRAEDVEAWMASLR
ncbi:aminopeptidase P family protein [Ruania zhangjianzhongii]|uniref:aminopeptidase P family protein n=1 Tax=Ruania zhangjianzhongii TaxID=2603206 RepID=UPI001AEF485B|nr:aminopeptidase P family protein [Ruania zhangjianzhongii]